MPVEAPAQDVLVTPADEIAFLMEEIIRDEVPSTRARWAPTAPAAVRLHLSCGVASRTGGSVYPCDTAGKRACD